MEKKKELELFFCFLQIGQIFGIWLTYYGFEKPSPISLEFGQFLQKPQISLTFDM